MKKGFRRDGPMLPRAALAMLVLSWTLGADAMSYRANPIKVPPGSSSYPIAINDSGDIVGVAVVNQVNVGFIGGLGRAPTSLPAGAIPADINASGWVVGQQNGRAFVYRGGVIEHVPTPDGFDSVASAINDAGDVVGWFVPQGTQHPAQPFLYRQGAMVALPNVPADARFEDINFWGKVLGYRGGTSEHTLAYQDGVVADVGPGPSRPGALNANGDMVVQHARRALLIAASGDVRELGTVAEFRSFGSGAGAGYHPADVNLHRVVVGSAALNRGFIPFFFAWIHAGGKMHDLSQLIEPGSGEWRLQSAVGINDKGQIAAQGCNQNGCHVLLLDPMPTRVIEYRNQAGFPGSPGGHFFYTDDPAEIALLDSGVFGQFVRTGKSFAGGGPVPLCRFYGSVSPGPNSHFYTASDAECAWLMSLQQTPIPADVPQWNHEGAGFGVIPLPDTYFPELPCGEFGLRLVYRAYNNAFPVEGPKQSWDSNHRYSTSFSDLQMLVDQHGWRHEGGVFCVRE